MISSVRSKPTLLVRPLIALSSRTTLLHSSPVAQVARRQLTINASAASAVASQRLSSPYRTQVRFYADYVVKVPHMADSISEGSLKQWNKKVGDFVALDEEIATIETDKVDVAVNSPKSGTILELYAKEDETVAVGADLFKLELGDAPAGGAEPKKETSKKKEETPKKEAPKKQAETKKEEPKKEEPKKFSAPAPPKPAPSSSSASSDSASRPVAFSREERSVKMNRMRQTIAKRLKQSQENAASLTTFNEVDMSNLMNLRSTYKDAVLKKHNVKLGFMSAFVKASCYALKELPAVNARIEGDSIVYNDYVDVSVAVATPKGLVTPVIRNAESMSFVEVEKSIAQYGAKARGGQIAIEDLSGGTFTISNGGVFGSMMGTPIINMPQSAILGMHAIKERPVAINGKVEIRPMMYIALTYDHRIIDGREATTFLVKLKEVIEDPARLLLDV
ncbi:2-oxoglutarate dehydrogenase E2 component (dihydrolipoamide succinyltransferase) [Entomortierella parvispora]|uniref:dihydrolipoyllysine-residue succinyltransferase n=1 Tax=Entomortierella parvispora TaxID=205924 RepID=A0A9P3HK18_9FUNG|nr:2-oxoglutarate dehydrogenase E2 component (dihydrolipoamide succinyltransferase) [Entomortierella parvispora]